MKRRRWIAWALGLLLVPAAVLRADDPGREVVGALDFRVYFGTDGDPAAAGERAVELGEDALRRLASCEALEFLHYRELGHDRKPVFRSYENWAEPVPGSEEILCRFEVQERLSEDRLRLDLELWLSHRKVLKAAAVLAVGKPLMVLGPEWRDGRLIFAVELATPGEEGS